MGNPQTTILLKTYNSNTNSFVHENIAKKKSKSWDMRFYWLWNKQQNHNFDIYWDSSHNKLAGYYRKNHTVQHQKDTRNKYVREKLKCMLSQYMN